MTTAIYNPLEAKDLIVDSTALQISLLRRSAKSIVSNPINQREFFEQAWPIIEPAHPLLPSWHIDLILEYLAAVDMGQIKRLIINIPPRSLKSSLVTIAWPAWSWTGKPWLRWLFCSYSAALSVKHSVDRRRIIESPWYRKSWGDITRMEDDQNQKAVYQNTQRGIMISTSVGGSITGMGGDRIVIDDLINPLEAESKVVREASIDFYQKTLSTRLDDKKTGVIVAVEQRTHHQDLTGTVLKETGWTHLRIPAEAPATEIVRFPMSDRTQVRAIGEVICPAREDVAVLEQQKIVMGSRAYAAQYQQDPIAEDSAYFNPAWWQYYRMLPISDIIRHWSWDTAMEDGEQNDETAGILFAHLAHGTFVERVVRGRWQTPEAKRTILNEFSAYPANALLIEDSPAGKAIIQSLQRDTGLPIIGVPAVKDKIFRASLCAPFVESRRVFLKEGESWLAGFVEQLTGFPNLPHDDVVDAFTQGMNFYHLGPTKPVAALSGQTLAIGPARPSWL